MMMEMLLSICLGIGLAASCGFRIFLPLLVMSIASKAGHLTLSPSFEWIGSYPAVIVFGVATVLEICAYYIPWVDNFLDTISTPAAVVAGTITAAATFSGMSPLLKWSLAVIAGGGVAGVVQGGTSAVRAASTFTTGGIGNPVVSTAEAGGSAALSVLSVIMPFVAAAAVVIILFVAGWKIVKWRRKKPERPVPGTLPAS